MLPWCLLSGTAACRTGYGYEFLGSSKLCCAHAGNRGFITGTDLEPYNELDVKVWHWTRQSRSVSCSNAYQAMNLFHLGILTLHVSAELLSAGSLF